MEMVEYCEKLFVAKYGTPCIDLNLILYGDGGGSWVEKGQKPSPLFYL